MKSKLNEYTSYIALYVLGLGVAHSASLWASVIIVRLSPSAHTGNIADNYSFWLTRDFPLYHALIQTAFFTAGYLLGAYLIVWALHNRKARNVAWSALTAAALLLIWIILDNQFFQSWLSTTSYNGALSFIKDTAIPASFFLVAWWVASRQKQPAISDE